MSKKETSAPGTKSFLHGAVHRSHREPCFSVYTLYIYIVDPIVFLLLFLGNLFACFLFLFCWCFLVVVLFLYCGLRDHARCKRLIKYPFTLHYVNARSISPFVPCFAWSAIAVCDLLHTLKGSSAERARVSVRWQLQIWYNVTACVHSCSAFMWVLVDLTHGVAALTPRFDALAGMRFHTTICLVRRYAQSSGDLRKSR